MDFDSRSPVVVLAGGTGGAKLARGWGLKDDTFHVMDGLRELGVEVWFNLGDRDLAYGVRRAELLAGGARLTEAIAELTRALGVRAQVIPMADAPVRTSVRSRERWVPFQEFMVRERAALPIDDVRYDGIAEATVSPEVLAAVAAARAVIVGPSNPVISIRPILAVPGMADALRATAAPVVAISPVVGGEILKGPSAAFLQWAGVTLDVHGIAGYYGDLLDGFVADEPALTATPLPLPYLQTDTLLNDTAARAQVAETVLHFAEGLR